MFSTGITPLFNNNLKSDKMKEYIKNTNERTFKNMIENNKKKALKNCFLNKDKKCSNQLVLYGDDPNKSNQLMVILISLGFYCLYSYWNFRK